jgi:polyhydroxybutyrate depolymerase
MIGIGQNGPFYFIHNNTPREFYLHIPNSLPANSPIIYIFHGWGGNGFDMMNQTAFNYLSDENNFAVCYPTALIDGDNGTSGLTSWNTSGINDIDFINSLNDSLLNIYEFDTNKIFATGFSYGGEMSLHLARCQSSNVFDGIASVGGSIFDYMDICSPSVNTSVLLLHGTNDNIVNYNGGIFPGYGSYWSVPEIVNEWVNYNSCSLDTTYDIPDINNDNSTTEVTKYNNINTGDKVWLYKVNNGSHDWFDVPPWGSDDFWASEEIWNFFNQLTSHPAGINNIDKTPKQLIKIVDVLGRETPFKPNTPLLYIYDDGTVERKVVLK